MEKTNESTDIANVADENTDLSTLGEISGTAARPKGLDPNDLSGTEGIGVNDIRLPRLAIAQGLSPQVTPGDGAYIDGLKLFDLFNDLTGEIIGKGPVTFVPVRRDIRRIEFRPRSEGGGVVDPNVPPGDKRLRWLKGAGPDGKDLPPAATEFQEFVILMLRPGKAPEPIMLSIAQKNKFNRKAAEQLTTFIKLRNAPIYAGLYSITAGSEKNDKGTFGVPIIKNAGFVPVDTPAGKALFEYAKKFHDSLKGKNIVVDREPGVDDDFDPAALEAEGAAAGAKTTEM